VTTPVGSIRIDLTIDGSDLWGDVAREVDKAVGPALAKLQERLSRLERAQDQVSRAAAKSASEQIGAADAVTKAVNNETRAFEGLAASQRAVKDKVLIRLDADIKAAQSKLTAMRIRQEADRLNIKVDIDTAHAEKQLRLLRLQSQIAGGGGGPGGGGPGGGGGRGGGFGGGGARGLILPGVVNAAALVAGAVNPAALAVAQLTANIQQLAGAGLALPGIYASIGASVGVAAVGFMGLGDAVKEANEAVKSGDWSKFNELTHQMAPNFTELARSLSGLVQGPLLELQRAVQQNMFAGTAKDVEALANTSMPMLTKRFSEIGTAWNQTFRAITDSLGSDTGQGLLDRILGNTGQFQAQVAQAIDPLITGIGTLVAAGSDAMPRLGAALGAVATRFSDFITQADQDGRLSTWINDGITGLTNLGNTALNIGKSITAITQAAGTGNFLQWLEQVTAKMAAFLNSTDGQNKLGEFFTDAKAQGEQWLTMLQSMLPVLQGIYNGLQQWSSVLLPALTQVFNVLGTFPVLIEAVTVAFSAWATMDGVKALIGMLGGVTAALGVMPAAAGRAATGISATLAGVTGPQWLLALLGAGVVGALGWGVTHPGELDQNRRETEARTGVDTGGPGGRFSRGGKAPVNGPAAGPRTGVLPDDGGQQGGGAGASRERRGLPAPPMPDVPLPVQIIGQAPPPLPPMGAAGGAGGADKGLATERTLQDIANDQAAAVAELNKLTTTEQKIADAQAAGKIDLRFPFEKREDEVKIARERADALSKFDKRMTDLDLRTQKANDKLAGITASGGGAAGVVGSKAGLQPNASRLFDLVAQQFPQIQNIGGVRADALPWHPSGRALDIMIPGQGGNNTPTTPEGLALGNQIWSWMNANADQLGIDMGASLWQKPDHFNHIHAAVKGGPATAAAGLVGPGGLVTAPGAADPLSGLASNMCGCVADSMSDITDPLKGFVGDAITGAAGPLTDVATSVLGAAAGEGDRPLPAVSADTKKLLAEGNPLALASLLGYKVGDYSRTGSQGQAANLTTNEGPGFTAQGQMYSDTAALIDRSFTSLWGQMKAEFDQLRDVMSQVRDQLVQVTDKLVTVAANTGATAAGSAVQAGMAYGGAIYGGRAGRDSVPALLMPGEHVFTTDDVARMGGQAGVYRFRAALAAGRVQGFATGGGVNVNDTVGAEFFGVSEVPVLGAIVNILVKVLLAVLGVQIEARDTLSEITDEFRQFRGDFKAFDASGRLFNDTSALSERSSTSEETAAQERIRVLKIVIQELIQFIIEKVIVPIAKAVANSLLQAVSSAASTAISGSTFGVGEPIAGSAVSSLITGIGSAGIDIVAELGSTIAVNIADVIVDLLGDLLGALLPDLFAVAFGPIADMLVSLVTDPITAVFTGLTQGIGMLLAPVFGLVAGVASFDNGGVATGTGMMPKATIAPERVLSPRQTDLFDRMVSALEGGGRSGDTVIVDGVIVEGAKADRFRENLLELI
jgi:hypothetical protein